MKITPLDIRRKEFKRSVRGYSDEEVDIFLDEVADEFERLFQENMELHDKMSRMDEQIAGHAQLKDALEKTLISAQLQAEELRANAHKESELILRDAEMKARGIVSDSYGETQKTQQTLVQLKLLEEDFRFKFRSLLEGYLRLLNQAPLASAGTEGAGLATAQSAAREPQTAPVTARTSPPASIVAEPVAAARPAITDPPAAAASGVAPASPASPSFSVPAANVQGGMAAAPSPAPAPVAPMAPAPAAPGPLATALPVAPAPAETPAAGFKPVEAAVPVDRPPFVTPPVQRATEPVRPVAPPLDDMPTRETTPAPPEPAPARFRWPDVPAEGEITQEAETAEAALTQEATMAGRDDEPLRRFFFGRQLNDVDDTFQPEEPGRKDKGREFEW